MKKFQIHLSTMIVLAFISVILINLNLTEFDFEENFRNGKISGQTLGWPFWYFKKVNFIQENSNLNTQENSSDLFSVSGPNKILCIILNIFVYLAIIFGNWFIFEKKISQKSCKKNLLNGPCV